jgi:hypothetical protein
LAQGGDVEVADSRALVFRDAMDKAMSSPDGDSVLLVGFANGAVDIHFLDERLATVCATGWALTWPMSSYPLCPWAGHPPTLTDAWECIIGYKCDRAVVQSASGVAGEEVDAAQLRALF